MKIAYLSRLSFSDCDFPLIREMQNQSVDVTYYILCNCWELKGTLFSIREQYPKDGIFPSSIYGELLEPYKNYIDLSKVRIVNRTKSSAYHPSTILLVFRVLRELIKNRYNIIHITLPLEKTICILYYLRKKMVLTLHDPFPHSNNIGNHQMLRMRKLAFKLVPQIILLNNSMQEQFCKENNVPRNRVFVSKLGTYECISMVKPVMPYSIASPYILFFGGIAPYKGVEYLIMAFNKICNSFPHVKLVIAGGGYIYFDKELYEGNKNIIILNKFCDISEIAGLLKNCLFTVCPYKDATQSGVVQTALTMGVPLVVTNVGALSDSVTNYQVGLVVQPCQSEALAKAMTYMLNHPQEIKEMKENIMSNWKPQMNWAFIVNDYLNCYSSKK